MSTAPKEDSAQRVGKKVWSAILRERDGDRAFKLTEATLVHCLRGPINAEFPRAAATKKNGGRDLLFDALVIASDGNLDELTDRYSGLVATAKKQILIASPDVSPDEIFRRAAVFKNRFKGCSVTPTAIAGRWPELSASPTKRTATESATPAPKKLFSRDNPPDGSTWRYAVRYTMSELDGAEVEEICKLDWDEQTEATHARILAHLNK